MFPQEITDAFLYIMATYWQFLSSTWPVLVKTKYHRTETKEVKDIQYVKTYVLEHLGYIPVFFFLVEVFGKDEYPGPYRGVEKGLLVLYQLLTGCSIAHMARFIPASSYHAIYHAFYVKHGKKLGLFLDDCMRTMFSSAKVRIMCALQGNPQDFKHVTLMIDGHDSRATYINAPDHASYYSYKLKKSGFRTQVCTDINGMVLFVSKAAPCSANNDGSMLVEMDLRGKVSKYDCVVIDGGYTLFVKDVVANNPHLGTHNFVAPIRKQRGVELTAEETTYNSALGSFRSSIESTFGEIGHLFQKFNGKSVIRVTDMETFTLQFKLACVLRNVKKFVAIGCVPTAEHHTFWMQPAFDYSNGSSGSVYDVVHAPNVRDKEQDAQALQELQRGFLSLGLNDDPPVEEDEELAGDHYEVEAIVGHRGPRHRREYLVKWAGYPESNNSWLTADRFDSPQMVVEYNSSVTRRKR